MNFSVLLEYRATFVTTFFATALWSLFHIIMIILLTYRTNTVFGWTRNEMLLLSGSFSIFWGLFHVVFTTNFRRLSEFIDRGYLDYVLVRPLDSQFQISLWAINYVSIFRILLGIGVIGYVIQADHLIVQPIAYILYVTLGLCGTILLYSFWLIVSTILIWQPRLSNIIDLLYMVSGMTRYPSEMSRVIGNVSGIFLLPLFLILSTPSEFIINRPSSDHVVILLVSTVILFFTSRVIWKNSLKYYTSANS